MPPNPGLKIVPAAISEGLVHVRLPSPVRNVVLDHPLSVNLITSFCGRSIIVTHLYWSVFRFIATIARSPAFSAAGARLANINPTRPRDKITSVFFMAGSFRLT